MASHDKVLVLAGDKETGEWSIVGTFKEGSAVTAESLVYEMESTEDPSARIVISTSDFLQF